jgi:ATP/maltotriose-dependent transcriptional regulator MalT
MRAGGLLLEREAVLAAAAGVVQEVRAGRRGVLFVVGEAGLGKTTCLGQAATLAGSGVRVGWGRGDVMEASLPFGVFSAALGAVGFEDLLAPLGQAGVGDVRAARFYRVLHWLQQVTHPLLLVLDDLHWADPDSLALLSFVCRRLAGLPVAVLAALRPWPPPAHELAEALVYDGHASLQRLAPLSEQAAATLLGARSAGAVAEAQSRALAALCGGNPLLLEQVAASLTRQQPAGGLARVGGAIGAEGIVLTRFAGLPPAALRVARAASVLGTRFCPAVAVNVAQVAQRQAGAALEALCASGLVHATTATMAEFVHPLFCQSLYHDMAAPVRAGLHARAFTALCEHGLEAEAVEHAIRGDLIGDQAAIAVVERAGRAALAAGALGTAVEHLRAAVRLAGSRAAPALSLALGEALVVGGHPAEAIAVYEQLRLRADLDPADRVQTLRMLGRAQFLTTGQDHASEPFAQAAALAETCGGTTLAELLLGEETLGLATLGPTHSLPLARRAYELTRTGPGSLRHHAAGVWGLVLLLTADPAGLTACDTLAREVTTESGELTEVRWGYGPLAACAFAGLFTERFADADHALALALAAAERIGAVEAAAWHMIIKALLATRQGQLAEALTWVERASPVAELIPYRQGSAGYVKAEILLLTGRLGECTDLCQRIEPTAAARRHSFALLRLWHVRAQLLHDAGDHASACALYDQILQLTIRMGIAEPCAVPWARHALISYLASQRFDDARRVIDWLERGAARLPCRWPRIAAATGQAALAEACGDWQAAHRQYQAALVLHQQVELPVDHIETLLGYGSFLRRRGQVIQARPHLAHALEIAEKCQATWLADQARQELAIAGGRRRRAKDNPTQLTTQEQRVARLAAAGQSNKAIAAQLFLSTKTIEYHLAQVYTKLGITSRRQLMTGHHDLGPTQPPASHRPGQNRISPHVPCGGAGRA